MKVNELIKELNKCNPDARVYIETNDVDHFKIDHVFEYSYDEVYLECLEV